MGTSHQREKRKKNGQGTWRLVRYADDFVLMVAGARHHAEALRDQVPAVLAPLGLRLAPEKTRTVHIDEGLVSLGFAIRRMRKWGSARQYVYTTPSRKSIQAIKDKAPLLSMLEAIRLASFTFWNWIVRLAPFGVFALFAVTAGTTALSDLVNLSLYLVLFLLGAFILAFWALPGLVSALAPVEARELLRAAAAYAAGGREALLALSKTASGAAALIGQMK